MMREDGMRRFREGRGFIAALDQSGGSTARALAAYGIAASSYRGEQRMFELIHEMRTRIMTAPAFDHRRILAAILFEKTMEAQVDGQPTPDYLWQRRGILPFLKIDQGLAEPTGGVRRMQPIKRLAQRLARAAELGVVGTKMRSVIDSPQRSGIASVVDQQFDVAGTIIDAGLLPIIEPEVSIDSPQKTECETILFEELSHRLDALGAQQMVALKLTLPETPDLYAPFVAHPNVVRVSALSGGYDQAEACRRLALNAGVIASFSRAFLDDLHIDMSDQMFNDHLAINIDHIHAASFN